MPRPEKVEAVAAIKDRLEGAQAVFLTEYAGLTVREQQTLRRGLRGSGAEYKVLKMSLARLAAAELGLGVDELLTGPTGIAFTDGDPATAAKVLRDFAGEHEQFLIKGALMGGEFLTPERVHALASIEPREVLLARLAGGFQAPMSRFAGLMAALLQGSATAFQQLLEKKQAASPEGEPNVMVEAPAEPESATAAAPEPEEAAVDAGTADADEGGVEPEPRAEHEDAEPMAQTEVTEEEGKAEPADHDDNNDDTAGDDTAEEE